MEKPAVTLDVRIDGPEDAGLTLVLGHGAGQDMDSPFMQVMAESIAAGSIRVVRFNFPYMTRARDEGRRRPPDREVVLLDHFRAVLTTHGGAGALAIGGKSLGGRMASLIADEVKAAALVCLGYPFHPPGKPKVLRTAHLERLETPTLICQGERDPFGNRQEISEYALSNSIRFFWAADGDHGFRPRKASGRTEADNLAQAATAVIDFLRPLAP